MDLLVVAATAPDLRGLHRELGERIDGHVRDLHVSGKAIGVGLPGAAVGSAKRVFQLQPRGVVLLGTCGIYPGLQDYQPLDVIVATQAMLVDHSVDAGRGAYPGPMSTRLDMHAGLTAGLGSSHARAKRAAVASTLSNTRDDHLAMHVPARHGCHAEHLETYAVASTCHLARIPVAAVLGVTHIVGAHGDADWKRFQRDATIVAAEALLGWIHAGAPGLPHGAPV